MNALPKMVSAHDARPAKMTASAAAASVVAGAEVGRRSMAQKRSVSRTVRWGWSTSSCATNPVRHCTVRHGAHPGVLAGEPPAEDGDQRRLATPRWSQYSQHLPQPHLASYLLQYRPVLLRATTTASRSGVRYPPRRRPLHRRRRRHGRPLHLDATSKN
ncbi:hypothetical protein EE612_029104 [Oryza sativa]|nr:hypothetical protein EE612_029104 [Oryza sativa]